MRNLILSLLSTIALLIYPLSLSAQNSFSLSLDVDGATGDQAVTSLNTDPDQVVVRSSVETFRMRMVFLCVLNTMRVK